VIGKLGFILGTVSKVDLDVAVKVDVFVVI